MLRGMSQAHIERRFRFFPLVFLTALPALFLALSLTGCQPAAKETATPVEPALQVHEYQVRGLVVAVGSGGRELQIHHEPVPDFVGIDGAPEPMDAMTMPFPVPDASIAQGIAAGDRVSFTFRVEWDGKHPLAVTRLEKLPAETRLSFEKGLP